MTEATKHSKLIAEALKKTLPSGVSFFLCIVAPNKDDEKLSDVGFAASMDEASVFKLFEEMIERRSHGTLERVPATREGA